LPELTAEQRNLALRFADVALPASVVDCQPWEWHDDDIWRRFFTVKDWAVGSIRVSVFGEQTHHGDVTYWTHVHGEHQCTDSERRQLISALIDAGDLLSSLG
jgi:hypothetical protein